MGPLLTPIVFRVGWDSGFTLLDLVEVASVRVERVIGFFVGPVGRLSRCRNSWHLSKATPNWLACQFEVISNLHRVRIITNQEAAVVL